MTEFEQEVIKQLRIMNDILVSLITMRFAGKGNEEDLMNMNTLYRNMIWGSEGIRNE